MSYLPHKVKMQYVYFRLHTIYYLCLGKFLKKLADEQCSSVTKGSIYHIKHVSIQPFTMGVDWVEIECLMEVSLKFDICTYCIITLHRRCCCSPYSQEEWYFEWLNVMFSYVVEFRYLRHSIKILNVGFAISIILHMVPWKSTFLNLLNKEIEMIIALIGFQQFVQSTLTTYKHPQNCIPIPRVIFHIKCQGNLQIGGHGHWTQSYMYILLHCFKEVRFDFVRFFSNFPRFWYQRKLIFFSLPLVNFGVEKCTVWKIVMKMWLVMVTIIKLYSNVYAIVKYVISSCFQTV